MVLDELTHLAHAVEQNWCAAWASLGTQSGEPRTYVEGTPEYLRVYTPGMPETLMNMVIGYSSGRPVTTADVARVVAPYQEHLLPFQWWLMRGLEPDGLRTHLAALGMQAWGDAVAMALRLSTWEPRYPPPLPGVSLTRTRTRDDAESALRVICEVFYVPPGPMARWTTHNPAFRVYLARWGMRPTAALATLCHNGIVGVYHVATSPGARRRGIAGNLLLLALRDARADGCTLATLTATTEARHLYEQLGFRACGLMEQWMPGPSLMHRLSENSQAFQASDDPGLLWD